MKVFRFKKNEWSRVLYALKLIVDTLDSKKNYVLEIKEARKKRSLDANAYFWVLVDKLSEATGIDKTTIYRNAIKEIGGVSDTVCVQAKAIDKLCNSWCKKGLGWQADIMPSKIYGCKNVVLYYGSSTYNTKQMSQLIDGIVQDCKACGIETMTPDELSALKASWTCEVINNDKNRE